MTTPQTIKTKARAEFDKKFPYFISRFPVPAKGIKAFIDQKIDEATKAQKDKDLKIVEAIIPKWNMVCGDLVLLNKLVLSAIQQITGKGEV